MAAAIPFSLTNQNNELVTLSSLRGHYVVLYFYPKDNTPGCTTEAKDFTALKPQFEVLNCTVLGISKDSVAQHCSFIAKQELTIDLLSDPENSMIEAYGAWQMKKNYGKEYMGIVRSTYLINPHGEIVRHWPTVRVAGHAQEVLEALKESTK